MSGEANSLALAYTAAVNAFDNAEADRIRPDLIRLLRFRFAMTRENAVIVDHQAYWVDANGLMTSPVFESPKDADRD